MFAKFILFASLLAFAFGNAIDDEVEFTKVLSEVMKSSPRYWLAPQMRKTFKNEGQERQLFIITKIQELKLAGDLVEKVTTKKLIGKPFPTYRVKVTLKPTEYTGVDGQISLGTPENQG